MKTLRALLLLLIVTIAVGAEAGTAGAHRNDESYLYLNVGTTTLTGRVEMPYPDLRSELGLQLSGSGAGSADCTRPIQNAGHRR